MNGPEHYREAERLIGMARAGHEDDYARTPAVAHRLAEAQVHATLALTAATAAAQATAYDGDEYGQRSRGWAGVA